jgi:cytochrome c553
MKKSAFIMGLLFAAASDSYAQGGAPGASQQQTPAAVQQCVVCHGTQGEGNPAGGFPRIAGQSQYYLAKQLESYAVGSRQNPIMQPIAKALSPQERATAAAFFAQLDAPAAKTTVTAAQSPDRGAILASRGDNDRRVQACANCHGPGGVGEPPAYPYLAGLDAGYLAAAINAWKSGARKNDGGQQMASVARALAPEDIAAVSHYYAGLTSPKPVPLNLLQAPVRAKSAPASPAATTQRADPRPDQSVGTEQGSPTQGGTQGPGGSAASKSDKPGNAKSGVR